MDTNIVIMVAGDGAIVKRTLSPEEAVQIMPCDWNEEWFGLGGV
jgi:hypothetical protein